MTTTDNPFARPLAPDITLSTGRIIRHTYAPGGCQVATPTEGEHEMTPAEWQEYCERMAFTTEPNTCPQAGARKGSRCTLPAGHTGDHRIHTPRTELDTTLAVCPRTLAGMLEEAAQLAHWLADQRGATTQAPERLNDRRAQLAALLAQIQTLSKGGS